MAGSQKLVGKMHEKAMKMLKSVAEILHQENIPYILEAGTLLGIIRENRLLPWDNDLDLTITADHAEKLLAIRWKFWLAGYRTRIRRFKQDTGPFKKGQPRILKIQTRKGFILKEYSLMDIFIKYDINGTYQWTVSDKQPVLKKCPKHFYEERQWYKFDKTQFLVPEDYTGYLAYHYGKNWRIPIKNWNFRTDDNCDKEELS